MPVTTPRRRSSAYGYTADGFAKPDLAAPGRYMIGPVPASSTLPMTRPDHVTAPGYMQLSGTSFAAPVVAAAAATLMAQHPSWTPDQVKGALMVTSTPEPKAPKGSLGVGEINIAAARGRVKNPPNPNAGLNKYLTGCRRDAGVRRIGVAGRGEGQQGLERSCLVGRRLVGCSLVERRLERRRLGRCRLGVRCLGRRRLERRGLE